MSGSEADGEAERREAGFSLAARARSFRFAGRGICFVLRSQHNARIHAAATLAAVALGAALSLSIAEWCWIAFAVTIVWVAEAHNTALEQLADAVAPDRHPGVGRAKDAAAGGVLIAALGAATIGLLVLGPRLLAALRGAEWPR